MLFHLVHSTRCLLLHSGRRQPAGDGSVYRARPSVCTAPGRHATAGWTLNERCRRPETGRSERPQRSVQITVALRGSTSPSGCHTLKASLFRRALRPLKGFSITMEKPKQPEPDTSQQLKTRIHHCDNAGTNLSPLGNKEQILAPIKCIGRVQYRGSIHASVCKRDGHPSITGQMCY